MGLRFIEEIKFKRSAKKICAFGNLERAFVIQVTNLELVKYRNVWDLAGENFVVFWVTTRVYPYKDLSGSEKN